MKQMAFRTSARVTHPSNLQLPEDCTPRLPAVPWLNRGLAGLVGGLLGLNLTPHLAAYLAAYWRF
jgi:hypothetical protein